MATPKSDFAHKLLSDLRLRKEKMAATQNSNRQQSGQMSSRAEKHGNPAVWTHKNAQQTNSTHTAVSRTGNSSRTLNRATSSSEPSNQLVLYESGQNSIQVKDLTTAIAFAFENTGKLTRIEASASNPLVNFFKRFGRGSMDFRKTNTNSFDNHNQSVSQIHITTEISKGVQKINQILRVCSNNINFDRNSFEVGKELLKGTIDLEESLRLLVNLQEASAYNNRTQQKSRIRFLDEDEDDEEEINKTAENWQLSRPRFSFDNNTSRNSYIVQDQTRPNSSKGQQIVSNTKKVSHGRSISYDQEYKVKQNNNSSSSQEKGRVSNVIAKLMGLEDLPQREEKETKFSRRTDKLAEPLNKERRNGSTNDKVSRQSSSDTKLHHRPEKIRETMNGRSNMVVEGNKPRKDSNVQAVGTDAALAQYHAIVHYQGNEHRIFQNHERELNLKESGEKKLPQKGQNRKPLRVEDVAQNKTERNGSVEKRNVNKDLPSNQHAPIKVQVLKKQHAEQKDQHLEKQDFAKQKLEDDQVESVISSKSKKISAPNVQKKVLRDISVPSDGKPRKFTEKIPKKESPDSRNKDDAMMVGPIKVTPVTEEDLKVEDKSQNLSTKKLQFDEKEERQEKQIPVSVTQKKAISQKVDKSENISKIDVLVTRRNASMKHLSRSVKKSTNKLQNLERHIRNKNSSSKRKDQQSDNKDKDEEISIILSKAPEKSIETVKHLEKLQNEAEQVIKVNSPAGECKTHNKATSQTPNQNEDSPAEDECKTQNKPTSPTPNENYDDQKEPGEVLDYLQKVDESCMSINVHGLGQCDQSSEKHKEDTELYNPQENKYNKLPAKGRQQKPLTEPEKELKEIVLKSQLFLNTAEALFKLNIPVSFLHTIDHNYESASNKLILDCGYEIMKRKARRHEMTLHPYMKTTISFAKVSSLDELVKQLCKDIEVLKSYGGNGSDIAESLHEMLNKDIYHRDPDANNMWDFEWNKIMMSVLPENEDVIRDVEKHMLNGLLDEITNDLLLLNVSA